MNNINDIADYIILKIRLEEDNSLFINMKLQKLLFYVQAWSYGINGQAMFVGDFEAWMHGPINREIYNRFSPTKTLYSEISLDDCINKNVSLSEDDAKFIDYILENYSDYSDAELGRLVRSEAPWIETRGNKSQYERCHDIISPLLMEPYYKERWKTIN